MVTILYNWSVCHGGQFGNVQFSESNQIRVRPVHHSKKAHHSSEYYGKAMLGHIYSIAVLSAGMLFPAFVWD